MSRARDRDPDEYVPGYLDEEDDDDEPRSKKSKSSSSSSSSSSSAASKKKASAPSQPQLTPAQLAARLDASKKKIGDPTRVMQKVTALVESCLAKASRPRKSLAQLGIENVKHEVLDMNSDMVRGKVERMIVEIAESILQGEGFLYTVPSRSSNNQLYVPELDRMVLKDKVSDREFASKKNARKSAITTRVLQLVHELSIKKIHVTKRDLFYTDVKLFQKQAETDDILDDLACMIGCTRTSLNVVASEKGVVVGCLSFRSGGDLIDCRRMGLGGAAIPPYIDRVTHIEGDAKFILLVEKDAAFMRLAEDRFYNTYPCIIITAKGQPDVATRLFLKKCVETLKIPVLGLFDADPYGLKILSVYMSGSKNMSYDSASLTTPDIKWLGVRPSDLDKYNIPQQCRLPMTEHDIKTGKELLQEDFIIKNPLWHAELDMMVRSHEKAEIQALSSFGFQYLTQVYLPLKLQEGDWI